VNDWLLLSLAIAQASMTFFFVGIVLIFGELGFNEKSVERKTQLFLNSTIPEKLQKISLSYDACNIPSTVKVGNDIDIFGKSYILTTCGRKYSLWFGLNVKRLFAIYFIEADLNNKHFKSSGYDISINGYKKWLSQEAFLFTFLGAQKVGYSVNFEISKIDDKDIISIWCTVDCSEDFPFSSSERLFWAQDIAMMTESLIRTAFRNNIKVSHDIQPRPL
tara:strand:+ start:1317 stop:1973 length:657 start_codon:yes stop_codon:yes gene_type:complete